MTTTTEKLAQAAAKAVAKSDALTAAQAKALAGTSGKGLSFYLPPEWANEYVAALNALNALREALAAHEADKQPVEDERGAFEVHAASDGLQLDRYPDGEYVSLITHRFWRCWQARAGRASAQAVPAWHELCRRLYVELFHCDQQMLQVKKYGKPVFSQGKTVRDVLADAKAALAAAPKGD